jgi:hypothetical protein
MPPGMANGLASQPLAQGLARGGHSPTEGVSKSVLTAPAVRQHCRANHWAPYISTG